MESSLNMSEQIIDHVERHGLLRSESLVRESTASLELALQRVADLVVNAFSELAKSASGREVLWDMASHTHDLESSGTGAGGTATSPRGAELVRSVLDDRYHGTVHAISAAAGVQPGTVTQLLEGATAAALDIMAGLVAAHRWSAQELGQWLHKQRVAVAVATPLAASAAIAAKHTRGPAASGAGLWLRRHSNALFVTVGLLAAAECGYVLGTRNGSASAEAASGNATNERPAAETGGYAAIPVANLSSPAPATFTAKKKSAVPVVLKLKNGLRQVIGANSTESKLYQMLMDPAKQIDLMDPTADWIGFDRIYFDSNKATLTNESLWQLSNVASILKRFPAAKIKIGGYTDSTGAPLRNLQLSRARAKAAMKSLVSLGVATDRLTAVGYGALDNIASNDTEEGRAINRRVSMQVIEK